MKHSKSKSSIYIFYSFVCLSVILTGCVDSSFRLEQAVKEAIVQAKEGNASAAINKLESLQDKHPNNADVAEALAIAYEERGNFLLASNYYQKAARLSQEKINLKLNSARNLVSASRKDDAILRLKEYLDVFPEDGDAWLELGRIENEQNLPNDAVDSLTRGLLLSDPEKHRSSDHQTLGDLYLGLSDYPQADYYLNQALVLASDQKTEALALQGLIQSSINQYDWDVADILLKRLQSSHPEIYSLPEIQNFRASVNQAFDKKQKVEDSKSEETEEANLEDTSAHDVGSGSEVVEQEITDDGEGASEEAVTEETNPDQQNEEEIETTERVVDEDESVDEGDSESNLEDTVKVDEVTLENEDNIEESEMLDEQKQLPPEETDQPEEKTVELGEETSASGDEDLEEIPEEPYVGPENEADLLILHAKQLIEEGDYPKAIRAAWDSVNKKRESPAPWFMLSYAYARYGQYLNAESAALEAVRLNPNNKKIVLQYLRVLQRSRSADRFHEELLNAYQRFNKDPDFVLALARSYARIKNDPENASALYRRFLDLAPSDERAAEVREEVSYVE